SGLAKTIIAKIYVRDLALEPYGTHGVKAWVTIRAQLNPTPLRFVLVFLCLGGIKKNGKNMKPILIFLYLEKAFRNFKRVLGIPKIMKTFEKPVPKAQLRMLKRLI
ncbi:hypothetical protein ACJX0J_007777, partial [Zea mays]